MEISGTVPWNKVYGNEWKFSWKGMEIYMEMNGNDQIY